MSHASRTATPTRRRDIAGAGLDATLTVAACSSASEDTGAAADPSSAPVATEDVVLVQAVRE